MTKASRQAGEFLDETSQPETFEDDNILSLMSLEWLEKINTRIDFASRGSIATVCRITSEDKPLESYAKWQAIHLFLSDRPELLDRYYQANAETRYSGGDEVVSENIKNGSMHHSVVHLWEFGINDPATGVKYYFRHLPGEEGAGWEYRFMIKK